jgi:carbohydrate-selective porin OprB
MDMLLKFADVFSRNAQVLGLGESGITREQVQRYLDNLKGRRINYNQIVGWENAKYTVLSLLQNILDGKALKDDGPEIGWGKKDLEGNYKESTEFLDKIIVQRESLKPQE